MLRVTLLGNLGADPEARFSAKGSQIVSFRVAVNQVRTGPDGERQENTEWFRVRAMGRQGEFAQRLGKGSRVLVIGRLDIGQYTGRDGESRISYDVWADEIQSMSARGMPTEPEGFMEPDQAAAEPALAGVSSLGSAPAASNSPRNGNANGKPGRRPDGPGGSQPAADLEDLPF